MSAEPADHSGGGFIDPSAVVDAAAQIDGGSRIGALSYVGDGCVLERSVSVGIRATITRAVINEGAVIGDAAVVAGPVRIGRGAVVRPGAVVTDDVPAHAVVAGNPAEVVGYTHYEELGAKYVVPPSKAGDSIEIAGCTLTRLPRVLDLRGALTFAEVGQHLTFVPRRYFVVYDVPSQRIRGSHAHHQLNELLFAVGGSVTVTVDNGRERGQMVLDDPTLLLNLRPMTWTTQYAYSPGAALVVLASDEYEDADYIRDYDDYVRIARG